MKKKHLRGAQLVSPSAFQCDRSRIPQKEWPNVARFKTTSSICLSYCACDLHEGSLFLFWLIWNLDDFETKPNHFGDTNSFHPDLVWPFWRQIWPGSWVRDFIWRWVCNQVEDLTKHAKGSKQDASLKYTCSNTSILHRNSDIGTLKQHGNKSSIWMTVNWSTFIWVLGTSWCIYTEGVLFASVLAWQRFWSSQPDELKGIHWTLQ